MVWTGRLPCGCNDTCCFVYLERYFRDRWRRRIYLYSKIYGLYQPRYFAMFFLGMFWKRTTGAAAVVGVILGFLLSVLFNEYAPHGLDMKPSCTLHLEIVPVSWEIPFHICMGLSFGFTVLAMVIISLAGPVINPKSFVLDKSMFKLQPNIIAMIVITILIISALYVKFW